MAVKRGKQMWTGDKVKALRSRFSETQQQFADRLGVSFQAVSWWEKDRGRPSGPAEKLLNILKEQLDSDKHAAASA